MRLRAFRDKHQASGDNPLRVARASLPDGGAIAGETGGFQTGLQARADEISA